MPKFKYGKFQYGGGREIRFEGEPFISIAREGDNFKPTAVDSIAKMVVKMLNRSQSAKTLAKRGRR